MSTKDKIKQFKQRNRAEAGLPPKEEPPKKSEAADEPKSGKKVVKQKSASGSKGNMTGLLDKFKERNRKEAGLPTGN